ncbi:TPA: type II secretion system F family protein [Candidatus Ventrenecus avicola]|nr:type II secretion system F family protein [Candidatus Ventrenecus avicola]
MENYSWQIYITQGIVILILIFLIIYLIRQRRVITLEKRFEKFALISIHDYEKSFFDIIVEFFWGVVHRLGLFLKKSVFLKKYSLRYEKHIKYENRNTYTGMDYIAIKFLVGLLVMILYVITVMFQLMNVSLMSLLIAFLIGFFVPDIFLQYEYQKKRKRVEEDLLKAIIMMNNSFKSGRNIMQAVEVVKEELEGPISDEFKKIYLDMTYGLSIEVVFDRFYNRVKLDDAKYITSSLTMLNKTGGNIVKVFSTIEKNFFSKKKLQQEMMSLTSASIFVFRILCVLPFLFICVIYMLNPSYFAPLFTTGLGRLLLILIILFYILYIMIIKKVLEVKM